MTDIRSSAVVGISGKALKRGWEWQAPAHWFDPGIAIAVEELVLIEAIDRVYPELRLEDRVAFVRDALRKRVRPEVMEPAHFHHIERSIPEGPAGGRYDGAITYRTGFSLKLFDVPKQSNLRFTG